MLHCTKLHLDITKKKKKQTRVPETYALFNCTNKVILVLNIQYSNQVLL